MPVCFEMGSKGALEDLLKMPLRSENNKKVVKQLVKDVRLQPYGFFNADNTINKKALHEKIRKLVNPKRKFHNVLEIFSSILLYLGIVRQCDLGLISSKYTNLI